MIVRAYYLLDGAPGVEGLVPTLRVVPKSTGVARAAMNALLDPDVVLARYGQLSTGIPSGTQLLGIAVKNGVATVDLSSEFASGTVTEAFVPLKESALPNLPAVDQVVFDVVPLLPLPDRSATLVPLPSSKPHAPVRPGSGPLGTTAVISFEAALVLPALSLAVTL